MEMQSNHRQPLDTVIEGENHHDFAKNSFIVDYSVGVGFVGLLLGVMLSHLLDLQEGHFLKSTNRSYGKSSYVVDEKEGRVNIRIYECGFVINIGHTLCTCREPKLVTTVGYGNQAIKSIFGRLFGSIWLFLSTLGVVRVFLGLAREMVRRICYRNLSVPHILDADLDQSDSVSKSEFILRKLKKMRKLSKEDMRLVGWKFDNPC